MLNIVFYHKGSCWASWIWKSITGGNFRNDASYQLQMILLDTYLITKIDLPSIEIIARSNKLFGTSEISLCILIGIVQCLPYRWKRKLEKCRQQRVVRSLNRAAQNIFWLVTKLIWDYKLLDFRYGTFFYNSCLLFWEPKSWLR